MHIAVIACLWLALFYIAWQHCGFLRLEKKKNFLKNENENLECFVHEAAHDLKAPLRTIDQIADRLYRELEPVLTQSQKDDITLLRQRAGRAVSLVDDILEYWMAGQGRLKCDDINNAYNVMCDYLSMQPVPDKFSVSVSPLLKQVDVHSIPFRQVMTNLIENAAKHHDKETGAIFVGFKMIGGVACFTVDDDGAGIDFVYREKVFKTFEMLKSRDDVEGNGLGLSLVRRIVRREGGEAWIETSPRGGCRVLVAWPRGIIVRHPAG